MKKRISSYTTKFLILSVTILIGCRSSLNNPAPTNNSIITTTKLINSITLTETKTPEPITDTPTTTTQTLTLSPTQTSTFTPIPSLTPLPTLNPEAVQEKISELMQTNGNCQGPCFWGIYAGQSSYERTIQFLKTLDPHAGEWVTKSNRREYVVNSQYKNGIINVYLQVFPDNTIVQSINVHVEYLSDPQVNDQDWSYFRPDRLMKLYGVPSRVTVVMGEGPEGGISYTFFLFFGQQRIYIEYFGSQGVVKPQTVIRACPLQNHGISGFILGVGDYETPADASVSIDITRFTELNEKDIYQILINGQNGGCFNLDWEKYINSH